MSKPKKFVTIIAIGMGLAASVAVHTSVSALPNECRQRANAFCDGSTYAGLPLVRGTPEYEACLADFMATDPVCQPPHGGCLPDAPLPPAGGYCW